MMFGQSAYRKWLKRGINLLDTPAKYFSKESIEIMVQAVSVWETLETTKTTAVNEIVEVKEVEVNEKVTVQVAVNIDEKIIPTPELKVVKEDDAIIETIICDEKQPCEGIITMMAKVNSGKYKATIHFCLNVVDKGGIGTQEEWQDVLEEIGKLGSNAKAREMLLKEYVFNRAFVEKKCKKDHLTYTYKEKERSMENANH